MLSAFSVAFWIIPSKRFSLGTGTLFCLSHTMTIPWSQRWQYQKRLKKEGKKWGYLKTHFSFQHNVLLRGGSSSGVNPEQYQLVHQCDLPGKAAVQLFMVILLGYESTFFNFVKEAFCQRYKWRPSPCHVYGFPCVSQFLCVVTNGAKFPKWQLLISTDCCRTPLISQQGLCKCLFPPFLSLATGPCAVE